MVTVATYFAEQLSAAGVTRVYGLPGGENVEILEAFRQQGIDFLLVKNESSACYMAATDARLTGKIGVALTTLGPGAVNAYAGTAHAYLDRAPILLITAITDPALIGRHTHQALDLGAVFQPICKFTTELSAANAVRSVRQAIRRAEADRPGPVHLSLHNRVALQQVEYDGMAESAISDIICCGTDMNAIHTLLADKRKPIVVVGLGLEPQGSYSMIRVLAESLRAPVIDTPKSKGALSAEHPLFAGTIGLTREDPVYELLGEADCIIAIGFDVVELVKPWDYVTPLIWVANWKNTDPRIACELEAVGNIDETLSALAQAKAQTADNWGAERLSRFRETQATSDFLRPQANRILPQTLMTSMRENTPDDILVTTDVGSHKIFTALTWQARVPNRYFVSNGLSAMGFGLCSAIAAAEITRNPAVCITGDAGLAMVMGELGLLVEQQLPVLVVVMNDAALDLIRSAQLRQGRPSFGTEFLNPNYEFIARAYGLAYRRVESKRDCDGAFRDGISSGEPMLIDVMIDPVGYPTTVRASKPS